MYNCNDIQNMITACKNDEDLAERVVSHIKDFRDSSAVRSVIREGYYEYFDRYDSDVCEQFISAFEKESI